MTQEIRRTSDNRKEYITAEQHAECLHFDYPTRVAAPLAITHVTVIPMDEERQLPDHTVIIEDGFIRALGPSSQIDTAGMQIVDGAGKYLMPGLADMHVHYWDPTDFTMYLANGVTTVRNMWGHPMHLAMQHAVRRGKLPGPHVITTTPIIDGPDRRGRPVHEGSIVLTDPDQADALIRGYAERGYQQTKAYSLLKFDTLEALGRASARYGLRMVGHCPRALTFEQAIAAGMTCFEHLSAIHNGHLKDNLDVNSLPLSRFELLSRQSQYIDFTAIRNLAQQMAALHIWNCPTLVVLQPGAVAQAVLETNPLLRYELPIRKGFFRRSYTMRMRDKQHTEQEWQDVFKAWNEMNLHITSILYEEGVPLLLGTDTANPYIYQGFSLHEELANLVRAGLSPYAALRCGTSEAARFMGESALWGTVAVGKRADLLLTRANPMQDVAAVRVPEAVFVNGFYFTRHDLDALLSQRADLAQNLYKYLPTELEEVADGEGEVLRQGILNHRLEGIACDRLSYRHSRLADGTLLIEEKQAVARRPRCMTSRLWLDADGSIFRAERRSHSLMGEELCSVERSAEGEYTVYVRDWDGHETSTALPSSTLVPPPDRLAMTVVAQLLTTYAQVGKEVELPTLSIEDDGARLITMKLMAVEDDGASSEPGQSWQVALNRPGGVLMLSYRLAADGRLISITSPGGTWMH